MKCPQCGGEHPADFKFCPGYGNWLSDDGETAAPARSCNMMRLDETKWTVSNFYMVTPGVFSGVYAGEHPMMGW